MGVTFSLDLNLLLANSDLEFLIADTGSKDEISKLLRVDFDEAKSYVLKFTQHRLPPVCDNISMCLFFQKCSNADEESQKQKSPILLFLLWKIFQVQSICYMQEILVLFIMLSKEEKDNWRQRLSLLFDLFKGAGDEELYYDDIMLIAQVVGMSLARLWAVTKWDQPELNSLTEGLADHMYNTLKKEIDEPTTKTEFLDWAGNRFKDSHCVDSVESLMVIYRSPFA